jgi:hypothetical protein
MFDLVNGGPGRVDARFTNVHGRYWGIRVLVTVTNGALDISITPPNGSTTMRITRPAFWIPPQSSDSCAIR